jgi:hypothetical protein
MNQMFTSDIVNLNVGGTRFSTSRQTLCSIQDSFFSSLLSGRIPTCRDESGALFIDRDPKYFSIILNFLRTKELELNGVDISSLRHEAEFFGISPLVKRLMLCEDLERSLCGDVLFTGFIPAPVLVLAKFNKNLSEPAAPQANAGSLKPGNVLRLYNNGSNVNSNSSGSNACNANSGLVMRNSACNDQQNWTNGSGSSLTSQSNKSNEVSSSNCGSNGGGCSFKKTHSRKSSNETSVFTYNFLNSNQNYTKCHSRNQSLELKQIKTDLGLSFGLVRV